VSTTVRAHLGNYVYNNLASSQGYYNRLNEAAGPVNLHRSVLQNGFRSPQFFSDVYVEDASFLRMDNLTLGYTLPRLAGLQQDAGLRHGAERLHADRLQRRRSGGRAGWASTTTSIRARGPSRSASTSGSERAPARIA
jgi:hypothetical protein